MFEPLFTPLFSSLFSSLIDPAQRVFITVNGVDEYFTFQNTKTFPDDFDLSIDAVLPTGATTVTLFGQTASADHYIKVLSTGFASINIDTSIVTSTVLATKDSKQRRYGVRVVGDDFIFTEEGVAIDTVTDAVAAAKTLIINVLCQSNGADFFNRTASDPILTDLTTASNSVSWQLNRALPATTEQSTDGTNLLTYVGAPKTELFTFNQSDKKWNGSNNQIVNGRFDTDTVWTKGDGWSIGGGTANCDGTQVSGSNLIQPVAFVAGSTNSVVYEVSKYVSGGVSIGLGSASTAQKTANGTFTEDVTFIAGANALVQATVDFVGSVDNISIKRFIQVA